MLSGNALRVVGLRRTRASRSNNESSDRDIGLQNQEHYFSCFVDPATKSRNPGQA